MVLETAMSLASPWPLKVVLDSVIDRQPPPDGLAWFTPAGAGSYLNSFYSSNIGQRVAHDLRRTMYGHLHRLSMSYYDRQQVGPLVSTITDDINAVQDFGAAHPRRDASPFVTDYVCPFTWRAICSCVANHTPDLDCM